MSELHNENLEKLNLGGKGKSSKSGKNTRLTSKKQMKIVEKLKNWDYVATPKCIRETFDINKYQARKVYNKMTGIKDGYKERRNDRIRKRNTNDKFKRILRNQIEENRKEEFKRKWRSPLFGFKKTLKFWKTDEGKCYQMAPMFGIEEVDITTVTW